MLIYMLYLGLNYLGIGFMSSIYLAFNLLYVLIKFLILLCTVESALLSLKQNILFMKSMYVFPSSVQLMNSRCIVD